MVMSPKVLRFFFWPPPPMGSCCCLVGEKCGWGRVEGLERGKGFVSFLVLF